MSINRRMLKTVWYMYTMEYYSAIKRSVVGSFVVMQMWVLSLSEEDPLERELATHFSILAWEIPWTEKPGGLQSTGSHRQQHEEDYLGIPL